MAGVRVAVRVRPFNSREKGLEARLVVEMAGETQVMGSEVDGGFPFGERRNSTCESTCFTR